MHPTAIGRSNDDAFDQTITSMDRESRSVPIKAPQRKAAEKGGGVVKRVEKFFRRRDRAKDEGESG